MNTPEFPNRGFFKPGNKYGRNGRPKNSKSQIEPIRRRILQVVKRRVFHEKDLNSVETVDLLKFLASIMPKEGQAPRTQVTYISNVPREEPKEPVQIEDSSIITTATVAVEEEKVEQPNIP